jgi:hypothetical protein
MAALGCSKHTLDAAIKAGKIKKRQAKGQKHAKYHIGDARAWLEDNPSRKYTKLDASEVTLAEAAMFLGLVERSVRQHVSSGFYELTWASLKAYKAEKDAGIAKTDPRQDRSDIAIALELDRKRADLAKKRAEADMARRKNAREQGDTCSRSQVRAAFARLAAIRVASEQRLLQQLVIHLVQELLRAGIGVGREQDVAGIIRSVGAREIQTLRDDDVAALQNQEGLPGLVDEARRLAATLAAYRVS